MTKDDIIKLSIESYDQGVADAKQEALAALEQIVAAARADEREALEVELLKLKKGIAANSEYIQGRWDLIGEFQDVIRARGTT